MKKKIVVLQMLNLTTEQERHISKYLGDNSIVHIIHYKDDFMYNPVDRKELTKEPF